MKKLILYITIFLPLQLNAQLSVLADTIKIKEVVIRRNKTNSYLAGFKKTVFDSTTLTTYSLRNLTDLLAENSGIFIKSYGMGGIATISFRGTGANHTQITWNNININNPMLGQSDLSLIPVGLLDDIQIYFGGASMAINSGGIGGIINIESKPVFKKQTIFSLNSGLGSFGCYAGLVKLRTGNNNFQSVTKAYLQSSENNFSYLNTFISSEPVLEKRKNSQTKKKGFMQEIYFRKKASYISAKIWYESSDRNLPASMLSQQLNTGEKQFDESLRTILNYNYSKGANEYFFTGAVLYSNLNYINQLASIDSRNKSFSMIAKTGIERKINDISKLKVIVDEVLNRIKSNNYSQNEIRNTASVTVMTEVTGNNRVAANFLLRETLDKNSLLIPDFSSGIQYKINDSRDYFITANFSRNSRIPTMNELFWLPGGNPLLKNEYAFSYEVTYSMKQEISSPALLSFDLTFFRNSIKDMIQWHPGEYSYWIADNIQKVKTIGFESSLSVDYSVDKFSSKFVAGYTLTRAIYANNDGNPNSSVNQLMYVPINQANGSLRLNYRNVYSLWNTVYTGIRYIISDNSDYLPSYFLNNITTGLKVNLKENSADLNFNIDNLFNINYQTIAYFPLPGRSYTLRLLINISK